MAKVLVVYYSRSGNTERMAKIIASHLKNHSVETEVKKVQNTRPDDFKKADGIIIGSPTYYGSMAGEVKKLLDDSVTLHGRLDGVAELRERHLAPRHDVKHLTLLHAAANVNHDHRGRRTERRRGA